MWCDQLFLIPVEHTLQPPDAAFLEFYASANYETKFKTHVFKISTRFFNVKLIIVIILRDFYAVSFIIMYACMPNNIPGDIVDGVFLINYFNYDYFWYINFIINYLRWVDRMYTQWMCNEYAMKAIRFEWLIKYNANLYTMILFWVCNNTYKTILWWLCNLSIEWVSQFCWS